MDQYWKKFTTTLIWCYSQTILLYFFRTKEIKFNKILQNINCLTVKIQSWPVVQSLSLFPSRTGPNRVRTTCRWSTPWRGAGTGERLQIPAATTALMSPHRGRSHRGFEEAATPWCPPRSETWFVFGWWCCLYFLNLTSI